MGQAAHLMSILEDYWWWYLSGWVVLMSYLLEKGGIGVVFVRRCRLQWWKTRSE